MNKKQLLKFSLICLIIAIVVLAFNFYFFHFVTQEGFTFTFHKEAGKPFIANMIGQFGTMFLFASAISFIIYLIKNKEDK